MAQLRHPHLSREGRDGPPDESGVRRSVQPLIDSVDQEDPAFMFVAAELQRVRRTGGELDPPTIDEAIREGRRRHARYLQDEQDSRPGRIPESIVYYARRGPLVKIGYTTHPHQRFRDLLPDSILAWEPGGRAEEAQRHEQFRELRITNGAEYFHLDTSMDAHVEGIRAQYGAPDPTWPTLQTLPQKPGRLRLPELCVTPHLVTLEAGTRLLAIRIGTARVWIHRGKLCHVLEDQSGARLYFLSDLKSLKFGGRRPVREVSEKGVA